MKSAGKNYLKILLVILLASGLIYAFYNVLISRIQERENLKDMESITSSVLKSMNNAERMECKTSVYLDLDSNEEEDKKDDSYDMDLIHDFVYERLFVRQKSGSQIIDYSSQTPEIYSKGISPVYSKADVALKMIPKDRWHHYASENIYGKQWKDAKSDQISYGYLKDMNCLQKMKEQGEEEINGKTCTKYKAVIKNPLRQKTTEEESDNEFRKTLSSHGLNVMDLKKGYPEVYDLLKDTYNQDVEEMFIWTDEDGKMVRIEKNHTFHYYLDVMKENSEKIEEKAGQYEYPEVYCRQDYTYSPNCGTIEVPRDFEEL